jgi:Carboxypeptidase regulatory-like domain/TonB dependent receptor
MKGVGGMMHSTSRTHSRYLIVLIAVAIAGWSVASLWGQAIYGSIYGQVTDSTGAAIANATVTVKDVSKGTSVQVTTSSIGEYSVEHLIPDIYDVTVTATGFRGAESKGIRVSADTSPKVDVKLNVGQATESVTVTSEAPQLKTDRADVALVLDEKTVSDLPNSGRNFASLELLIPGTQVMGWSQNSAEDPQGSPTVQINGQHFSGVGYELDGAANQDPILGQIVINPPLDAVTEAKITTQDYDAQFGQAVAAVVTAQTKSGTNAFHGDLFEYRKTDATEARNPFSQVAPDAVTGRLIPSAKYNQFGGSLGGPILKNKAFFFVDYQGTRQILGSSARVTVPTALVQSSCASANIAAGTGGCDLSDYLTFLGPVKGQIYNPRLPGTPAFANNFIPAQYLSSQALQLLAMIPGPNLQVPVGQPNNFAGSGSGKQHNDEVDIRIDEQVSQRTHAFGRYSIFNNGISSNTIFGKAGGTGFSSPTNSFGGTASGRSQSAVAGMDIALSPQLLTDFRLGYLRYHVKTTKYSTADLATQVGIPGLNIAGQPFTSGPPAFYLNGDGISNFGSALGVDACNCPLLETEDQYQMVNNWTRILGTHSLKFGVDGRYARNLRVPSDSNRAGELSFSASDTTSPTLGGGFGLGSFLLGDVTSFNRYVSISTNAKESQKRLFTYIEDSWRVTPKLTFNYGLRWELYFPETVNGKGQGGFPDLNTGQIRVAGYGSYNTAMNVGKTWKTFAPRLGLAYQLNPKTVIRTGYGRSFDIGVFGSIFGHMVTQNLPVLVNQFIGNSGLDTQAFNLANGPTAFVFPAIPSNGAIPIGVGNNVKIRNDPNVFPTIDAWNVAVQRQLSNTTSVTVAYVGNKGTHTFMGDDKSTNPNEPAACLPAGQSITGHGLCFNPNAPVGSLTQTSDTSQLRPYFSKFGWTQDLTYYHNGFDTTYNALQLTFEKRFSQGLQLTANYALQRAYNYGSNEVYKKFQHGRTDDLRDHQLTLFGNYDLPFGKKGKYASGVPTWVDYLIGGYTLTTSLNWASGLPFSVGYGECGQDVPSGPCRPNKGSGSFPLKLTGYDPVTHSRTYFTPPGLGGAFTRPSLDQTGTSPRNAFNGPGFFNDDLALLKTFPIRESVALQFRMDAFNLFNHINPGNPGNTCIDCSGAGVITGMALGDGPRQLQFALTLKF